MAFDTSAGASIAVSATLPATFDAVGYAALTYTEIGEITNVGEFGKEFALVTHNPLASRGVKKAKGSFNNGSISPEAALDNDDAGQVILNAAVDSDNPIAIRITLDNGDVFYFEGLVMANKPVIGSADDIVGVRPNIEITHNPIVLVAA